MDLSGLIKRDHWSVLLNRNLFASFRKGRIVEGDKEDCCFVDLSARHVKVTMISGYLTFE